jgi:hypothetical protein
MSDTLGNSSDMPDKGGFSFADTAEELANDLIQSLVIDVSVALDFQFGLDLNPLFNSSATSLWDRIPDPFIQIRQFDLMGSVGVNEWTSTFDFSGLEFSISQAKAMLDISSTLSTSTIRITSPSQLIDLLKPPTEESDKIIFQASLDVEFPVFLMYEGVGVGARISFL